MRLLKVKEESGCWSRERRKFSCVWMRGASADRIHSPCSEFTPARAGSSSDLRCCGLACLRRDMLLLLSGLEMLLLSSRSEMRLRFAAASAKSERINAHKKLTESVWDGRR